MSVQGSTKKHIYYLKLTKDLSVGYLRLATLFNNFGISLVPVDVKDFAELIKKNNDMPFVLTFSHDINSFKTLTHFRQSFLDMAILNKKIVQFDVSSFFTSKISLQGRIKGNYFFFELPIGKFELLKAIIKIHTDITTSASKWPGGIRNRVARANISSIRRS